jgi:hypothetical protein
VNRRGLALAGALAIVQAAASLTAQQLTASRTLLASVSDSRNQPLVDLGPDDFVVTEDGEPREVISVYPADYPVAILIDNTAGAGTELEAIRAAVRRFIERVSERVVALGVLAAPADMVTTFEDERPVLLERLGALAASASAEATPMEGLAAAVGAIRAIGAPFSAIVIVTTQSLPPGQDSVRLEAAPGAGTTVHVLKRATPARAAAAGGPAEGDRLRQIADQTRGSYTTIFSSASYPAAMNSVADRLATEMMIEYLVPDGSSGGGAAVELGVRIPGARARGLGVSR